MESSTRTFPPQIKARPAERANALIGAALRMSLRGRVLLFVRLGWAALIVLTVSVFLLTIPARYSQLLILGAENGIALGQLGLGRDVYAYVIGVFDALVYLSYTMVGALIFARKSSEWIGLFASLALVSSVVSIVRPGDSLLFVNPALRLPLLFVFSLGTATIAIFIFIFPDGHFAPRWTRWVCAALCGFILYTLVAGAFLVQPMPWPPAPVSPILVLGIFAGALVQVFRYRRISDRTQKQQTMWVIYGLTISAIGLILFLIVVPMLVPGVKFPSMTRALYVLIGVPLFYLALMLFPLALAVSILRYRLWDIDLIISRTLIYVLLTGILAGLFAALEKVMQDVFVALTGQQSDLATVISTLVVVAAFTPLKDLLHTLVEHRFKDAGEPLVKLKKFGERVDARVSPIHPAQISRRLVIEAVTAFDAKGGAAYLEQDGETKLLSTVGAWDGEAAVCIPIETAAGATRFGMVALDDRKNGAHYTEREQASLQAVAQHVARALEEDQLGAAL